MVLQRGFRGIACAPDTTSIKCFEDSNPVWRREGELSPVCELCPATWPQDREESQDCCTSQSNMLLMLTAVLYSTYFTACFAKDKSIANLRDVVLMRSVWHFLNEPLQWDRIIHRVGILTCVSIKVGHSAKAYPALAILLWGFSVFLCVWGFFVCFTSSQDKPKKQ